VGDAATLRMAPRQVVDALITQGKFREALELVERVVEEVFCEPLNTAEIFGDAALDSACQRIGAAVLAASGAAAAGGPAGGTVFLASRLQASGGHSALLFDIARLTPGPITVLLTGVGGPTDLPAIRARFGGQAAEVELAPRGNRLAKLQWVQARLAALQPATVWLFNHHQDSVAVAAVQPAPGYRLRFAHHGDHHLCLGVHLPFGEHFDPHPMGFRNCRDVLGKTQNRYLPMAVPDVSPRADIAAHLGPLVTCTAAGSNKIEHAYWPAYAEVVAQLLARTGGIHLHAGRLSARYRTRIRRALAAEGVPAEAFRYLGQVRSVAQLLVDQKVDLYLSSFPLAGARTLVEAMAAGVPIAAHDHSGKRFLSAMDMLPPGSCFWSQPQELYSFLAANDRDALAARGRQARAHYESYQSAAAMAQALGESGLSELPPTAFRHRPDPLAEALRRSAQFSLHGLGRRLLLRTGRRLRSHFS
jgi:hypothetical protein